MLNHTAAEISHPTGKKQTTQLKDIQKRLTKRKGYSEKLIKKFKKMQYSIFKKKRISNYIIKNNFRPLTIKKKVDIIKQKILN